MFYQLNCLCGIIEMKTLKEQLQNIVDNKLLNGFCSWHICNNLKGCKREFKSYFEMSKNYAEEYHTKKKNGSFGWWKRDSFDNGASKAFITSEKYRFIKDVIQLLP